jgi:hypothetical protein
MAKTGFQYPDSAKLDRFGMNKIFFYGSFIIKRSSLVKIRYPDKYPTQPDYIGGPYRDAVLDAILF